MVQDLREAEEGATAALDVRHERQTVAMELSAALHHSRNGGRESNCFLTEPEPQGQERPRTFPRRSQVAPEPRPLVHLDVHALLVRRKEEEEERKAGFARKVEESRQESLARARGQRGRGRRGGRGGRLGPPLALFVAALDVDIGSGLLVLLVLLVLFLFRAVFPSVVTWPVMLGITAGMDLKDSTRVLCALRRLWQWLVHGWFFFLAQCSFWLQTGPDARHHGRYGPGHVVQLVCFSLRPLASGSHLFYLVLA